jgi:hypothetical protein
VLSLIAGGRRISPSIAVFFPAILFLTKIDEKRTKAHTIKYGTRIKTIPKHVQLIPDKYRSIFVRNKIAGKNTAIDGEIRRLRPNNGNTGSTFGVEGS